MKRDELEKILDMVSPGLSGNDLIPILSHVWFTGSSIMTYNDQIAISMPMKTPFVGAVIGSILINLIKNSAAPDVEFAENENDLTVKAGSSRFTLALMPKEAFDIFTMPKPTKDAMELPNIFFGAIDTCMQSIGGDPSTPEHLGITLIPDDKKLSLYSTNNKTMNYNRIMLEKPLPLRDRVTLSTEFCKQAIRIANAEKDTKMEIRDDYSLLTTPSGVSLFGRLIEIDRPLDFAKIFNQNVPEDYKKTAVEIPEKMRMMVERAIIITSGTTEKSHTTMSVLQGEQKNRLRFVSKAQSRGEVVDTALVDASQPEVQLNLDCKHLKPVFGMYDKMLITNRCLIMSRKDVQSYYIVASCA